MNIRASKFDEIRLMSLSEAQIYCGLGRNTTREWCESIGAVIHVGSRILYDRKRIDEAIDGMGGKNDTV